MDTLTRIIKRNTKKTDSSLNRFKLLESIGRDAERWCKKYKNSEKYKEDIERLENISKEELLNEIDRVVIQLMDDDLNRRKEPRLYEGK